MSLPQFVKDGVPTLTFSKGELFPTKTEEGFRQLVGESEAGLIRIATLSPPVTLITLRFTGLPAADADALRAWVRHPLIRGRATPFTYIDSAGVATEVRWWQDNFSMPQTAYGLYSVEIVLRVEAVTW